MQFAPKYVSEADALFVTLFEGAVPIALALDQGLQSAGSEPPS